LADFVTKRGGGAYGKIYALFNAAYSLGMLFGPVVAGFLYDAVGFWWQMVVFAGSLAVVLPVMVYSLVSERNKKRDEQTGGDDVIVV
jgi:MFS family permease